jgi:hypothetical protein
MAFAALAILGQRSAHSLPMGPVIAEPAEATFVSVLKHHQISYNERLTLILLTFHLTLRIHDHSSIICKRKVAKVKMT